MSGGVRTGADTALIAALAGGRTIADAAKQSAVSERTVYRRLQDPAFTRQVTAARSDMLSRTVGLLAQLSASAAVTLGTLLRADSESVRLMAARGILELVIKLRAETEIEARIAALEAAREVSHGRRFAG